MFVRQVKRKCSVRGCKNTDCFAISRTREIGNTVIICKSCLGNALSSLDEINLETKSNIPVNDAPAPALFYNAQALGLNKKADAADTAKQDKAEQENVADAASGLICPNCGRTFETEKGLATHLRYCKEQADE